MSIGAAVIGAVGGMAAARSQNRNQRRLMDVQYQNQRMLNQHGHDLQMDMWNKTNYGAQVKHMKEAGLNPALMYGSAGQGGTTGSQGGGSAASGNAAQVRMMDMQNLLLAAQKENIDANTTKTKAEANKIAGVDTEAVRQEIEVGIARQQNLEQDTKNKIEERLKTISEIKLIDVQKELNDLKVKNDITGSTLLDAFKTIGLEPKENETDMWIARGMIGAWLGKDFVKMMVDFRKPKPKFKN